MHTYICMYEHAYAFDRLCTYACVITAVKVSRCTFETGEDTGKDLSLHHHLCQLHSVLGHLAESGEELPLQLGVAAAHQLGEVSYCSCIHYRLGKLEGWGGTVSMQGMLPYSTYVRLYVYICTYV